MQLCLTITNFNSNTSHVTINLLYRCRTAPRVRDSNTSHVTINRYGRQRNGYQGRNSNTSHVTINRNLCRDCQTVSVIQIHLMLLLIQRISKGAIGIYVIQIHLMLLLISPLCRLRWVPIQFKYISCYY